MMALSPIALLKHGALARESLGFLLKMLATTLNVRLMFGTRAATDGEVVYLPHIPYKATPELVEMVVGNLFHEVAHLWFTDFDVVGRAVRSSDRPNIFKGLVNAIEDPRIEACLRVRMPGALGRIYSGRRQAKMLGFVRQPDGPLNALLLVVVLTGHGLNGMDVSEQLAAARSVLQGALSKDVVDEIEESLKVGFPRLKCTADALQMAQEIMVLIERAESSQPNDASTGDPESEGEDQTSDEEGSETTEAESSGSQSGGGSDEATDEGSDVDGTEAVGGSDGGSQGPDNEPAIDANVSILDGEVDNPGEADVDLKAALAQAADDERKGQPHSAACTAGRAGLELDRIRGSDGYGDTYGELRAQAASQADEVRKHFLALMGRARARRLIPRSSGRPRPGKFLVPGSKPFGRPAESLIRETAVGLIVDCSSSMAGSPARLAAQAAVALVEAASGGRLPVGVWAFTGSEVVELKRFTQPVGDAAGKIGALPFLPSGGTPLAQALEVAGEQMLARSEARKVLFVATDGEPNDPAHARAVIAGLAGLIDVLVIGIGGHSAKGLVPDAIDVCSIQDLGPALIEQLRARVIRSAA
ncbi:VWA domain-containing protein (plasmid) [Flagellatimonas centrodinii]|uniref:VWA domain-containing protein n=1 Tax=Flagellatimonas centrodinii TaxID=2806210 RepID=UPI001FEE5A20|nr:VWA domain-containing protein [Flagellatimonas centrodinii]ULQ48427.1 VWA domain-containing protein [Flagellatimonas centrodinii]